MLFRSVKMKDYIYQRVLDCAEYILQNDATVRSTAKQLCVSKSTVHKDVSERLLEIDRNLYDKVKKVLDKNLSERHIRGGIATKNKFKKQAD